MYNELTCLFGHHDYSGEETEDKNGRYIHLCKHCRRIGYKNFGGGVGVTWFDYDEKGNCVHEKWGNVYEVWFDYDKGGGCIHMKWDDRDARWLSNNGTWVNEKPKNWKYDTQ